MIEFLESIGKAILTFFSNTITFFKYSAKFFATIGDVFIAMNQLLSNVVPTWVGIFAIATIFVAILWIIIEVI